MSFTTISSRLAVLFCVAIFVVNGIAIPASSQPNSQFIFTESTAPSKSCHASTIADTPDGLIAAWFGGTGEGNKMLSSGRHSFGMGHGSGRLRWSMVYSRMDRDIHHGIRFYFKSRTGRCICFTKSAAIRVSGGGR